MEDCVAFCGLTEEEVRAVAEHEHMPVMAATALAEHLLGQEHGAVKIRDMIVDDIRVAMRRNNRARADELRVTLRRFLEGHPEADAGADVP
ncbi:MAG: hypothetical protein ACR2PO_19405 [Methyloligellaceae bacterium]